MAYAETSGGQAASEWPRPEDDDRSGACRASAASRLDRTPAIDAASSSGARLERPFLMGVPMCELCCRNPPAAAAKRGFAVAERMS